MQGSASKVPAASYSFPPAAASRPLLSGFTADVGHVQVHLLTPRREPGSVNRPGTPASARFGRARCPLAGRHPGSQNSQVTVWCPERPQRTPGYSKGPVAAAAATNRSAASSVVRAGSLPHHPHAATGRRAIGGNKEDPPPPVVYSTENRPPWPVPKRCLKEEEEKRFVLEEVGRSQCLDPPDLGSFLGSTCARAAADCTSPLLTFHL